MSARISPLRLEAFEQLPKHARRCVFWEVDPETVEGEDHLADPEFEKEAWLSMVMLEWGSCGQVATRVPAGDDGDSELPCLGYVLYAPPHAVPRALQFPSGPVSADAVLLTSMAIEPGRAATDWRTAWWRMLSPRWSVVASAHSKHSDGPPMPPNCRTPHW